MTEINHTAGGRSSSLAETQEQCLRRVTEQE